MQSDFLIACFQHNCRVLKVDSRNFVAWHYRRQITKLAGTDLDEELRYSKALIDNNFSNYSAWHNRATTLKAQQSMEQVISLEDLVAGREAGQFSAKLALENCRQDWD